MVRGAGAVAAWVAAVVLIATAAPAGADPEPPPGPDIQPVAVTDPGAPAADAAPPVDDGKVPSAPPAEHHHTGRLDADRLVPGRITATRRTADHRDLHPRVRGGRYLRRIARRR